MCVKPDNAYIYVWMQENARLFLKLFTCSIDRKDNKQEKRTQGTRTTTAWAELGKWEKINKNHTQQQKQIKRKINEKHKKMN